MCDFLLPAVQGTSSQHVSGPSCMYQPSPEHPGISFSFFKRPLVTKTPVLHGIFVLQSAQDLQWPYNGFCLRLLHWDTGHLRPFTFLSLKTKEKGKASRQLMGLSDDGRAHSLFSLVDLALKWLRRVPSLPTSLSYSTRRAYSCWVSQLANLSQCLRLVMGPQKIYRRRYEPRRRT